MNQWMTGNGKSFCIVFQSYLDNGRVIMKASVQWNSVVGKNFTSRRIQTRATSIRMILL